MNKFGFNVAVLLAVAGCVCAEAPFQRFNNRPVAAGGRRNSKFARQELAPELTVPAPEQNAAFGPYPAAAAAVAAPYPAAGWRPGRAFELPTEQAQAAQPQETEQAAEPQTTRAGGPYAPSGWKPEGRQLELPTEQQEEQQQQDNSDPDAQLDQEYGPPDQEYGTPAQEYGTPDTVTTEANDFDTTTTGDNSGDDGEDEDSEARNYEAQAISTAVQKDEGYYYVQLADGQVLRVLYAAEPDPASMGVNARLQVRPVPVAQRRQRLQMAAPVAIVPSQSRLAYTSQYVQNW